MVTISNGMSHVLAFPNVVQTDVYSSPTENVHSQFLQIIWSEYWLSAFEPVKLNHLQPMFHCCCMINTK